MNYRQYRAEARKKFINKSKLEESNFELKIADFGFSKKLKDRDDLNKTICGTPLYMAP